jgi:hypothetical protein
MNNSTIKSVVIFLLSCFIFSVPLPVHAAMDRSSPQQVSPAEARAIAAQAYLYGYPLVMNYKAIYMNAVWKESPDFKAPFNEIKNVARVSTPDDKAIVAPNADTPYSWAYLDLRAEPLVLTIPKIERKRYYSVQLIDAYTHNFAYIGTRATGNKPGNYLIAGPDWKGKKPKGVSRIIRCETQLALAFYRTQLFAPGDLENVKKVQAQYKVRTLSRFLGVAAPPPAPAPALSFPAWDEKKAQGPGFFEYLDLMLRLCPVHPSEQKIRERFALINVGGGSPFEINKLSPEMMQALSAGLDGMRSAVLKVTESEEPFVDLVTASMALFGSREQLEAIGKRLDLKDLYLQRYRGAFFGIYGNSVEEAVYPTYIFDSEGKKPDGVHKYRLRLPAGKHLPARAFWSITMYDGTSLLLVANPINRYLINSPMLPQMKLDADGGLTIYVQHDSPGKDKEPNWLPAPAGPFELIMRLYLPDAEVREHRWKMPPLEKVE